MGRARMHAHTPSARQLVVSYFESNATCMAVCMCVQESMAENIMNMPIRLNTIIAHSHLAFQCLSSTSPALPGSKQIEAIFGNGNRNKTLTNPTETNLLQADNESWLSSKTNRRHYEYCK